MNHVLVQAPWVLLDGTSKMTSTLLVEPEGALAGIFEVHGNNFGSVFQKRAVIELACGLVTGLFGGLGVITPEIEQDPGIRIHKMSASALQEGDLIVYRDAISSPARSAAYLGDGMIEGLAKDDSALLKCNINFEVS
jgi:hypothetical protein